MPVQGRLLEGHLGHAGPDGGRLLLADALRRPASKTPSVVVRVLVGVCLLLLLVRIAAPV